MEPIAPPIPEALDPLPALFGNHTMNAVCGPGKAGEQQGWQEANQVSGRGDEEHHGTSKPLASDAGKSDLRGHRRDRMLIIISLSGKLWRRLSCSPRNLGLEFLETLPREISRMTRKALGIDVASADWASIGSAVVAFDDSLGTFIGVSPGSIRWPGVALTPDSLADAIDAFVRDNGACVVALDGPQGWRDPNTFSRLPGVGRRCEHLCRTQGKTGIYPTTYPGNQRPWIEFSVQVFERLLSKPGVELADARDWVPTATYAVLECFPTSAWRTSGLSPLPGKSRRPALEPYIRALQSAYRLPEFSTTSHDDLQAVVAAIAAVGTVKGPAIPLPEGDSSRLVSDASASSRRLEGIIWNVAPLAHRDHVIIRPVAPSISAPNAEQGEWIRVTQKVVDQVARAGASQMQIAASKELGATRKDKRRIAILLGDERFELVAGDTHVFWRSHQADETVASFERLFSMLSDRPGERVTAQICFIDTD